MRIRIIWGALLGVTFLILVLQSLPWVLICFGIVHFMGQLEFFGLRKEMRTSYRYAAAGALTAVWLAASLALLQGHSTDGFAWNLAATIVVLLGIAYAIFAVLGYERSIRHKHRSLWLRALFFMTLPLAFAPAIASLPGGFPVLLLLFGASWGADTGAMFSGIFAGSTRLSPRLSPGKTLEGVIGGMTAAGFLWAGAALVFPLSPALFPDALPGWHTLVVLFCAGSALAVLGVFGDLTFSLFKREQAVKDYGAAIPGHGGVLDRFDSMFFVAPALYLLWPALASVIQ